MKLLDTDPDLQISGMRLWVHGREFPDATDYWDGNWLRVTACCVAPDAVVQAHGAFVHLGELVGLLQGCEKMFHTLQGEAGLDCMEPNLRVALKIRWNGSIDAQIQLTRDPLTQKHVFEDTLDQSYLPAIMDQCHAILVRFPLRQPENLPPVT